MVPKAATVRNLDEIVPAVASEKALQGLFFPS